MLSLTVIFSTNPSCELSFRIGVNGLTSPTLGKYIGGGLLSCNFLGCLGYAFLERVRADRR